MISRKLAFVFAILYVVGFAEVAFAYLDPGSGSMMLQLLLGGVVGVLAILKLYWTAFADLFRRKKQTNSTPPLEADK